MALHVVPHVGAARVHLEAMQAGVGHRRADQLGRDAAAFERWRNEGMGHDHHAVDEAVLGRAMLPFDDGLEAGRVGLVRDVDRHRRIVAKAQFP